jgi:hypothetical protein
MASTSTEFDKSATIQLTVAQIEAVLKRRLKQAKDKAKRRSAEL